jgi:hypothetical protein
MRAIPTALLAASLVACHSSASNDSNGGQTCAQLLSEAQSAVEQASANVVCATAADCVMASNSSDCWNACGVAVNQAGAAALDAALTDVNATTCAAYLAEGCKPNPIPPCVGYDGIYCVAGQCSGFAPPDEDAGDVSIDANAD